jgi:hypothetical protein
LTEGISFSEISPQEGTFIMRNRRNLPILYTTFGKGVAELEALVFEGIDSELPDAPWTGDQILTLLQSIEDVKARSACSRAMDWSRDLLDAEMVHEAEVKSHECRDVRARYCTDCGHASLVNRAGQTKTNHVGEFLPTDVLWSKNKSARLAKTKKHDGHCTLCHDIQLAMTAAKGFVSKMSQLDLNSEGAPGGSQSSFGSKGSTQTSQTSKPPVGGSNKVGPLASQASNQTSDADEGTVNSLHNGTNTHSSQEDHTVTPLGGRERDSDMSPAASSAGSDAESEDDIACTSEDLRERLITLRVGGHIITAIDVAALGPESVSENVMEAGLSLLREQDHKFDVEMFTQEFTPHGHLSNFGHEEATRLHELIDQDLFVTMSSDMTLFWAAIPVCPFRFSMYMHVSEILFVIPYYSTRTRSKVNAISTPGIWK